MSERSHISLDLRSPLLNPGQRFERTISLEVEPISMGGQTYEALVEEGAASVRVERVSGGFLLTVMAEGAVYGPCVRCLEEVKVPVSAEQQEFIPVDSEKWQGTEVSEFVDGLVVDVSGLAREAIILALPTKLLCAEKCVGICPQCGRRRDSSLCCCDVDQIDPRFEKLRGLASQS
jgi:uncharacterized protein